MKKKIAISLILGTVALLAFVIPAILKTANPLPPGESQEEIRAKKQAQFLIDVIEVTQEKNGQLPQSLDQLMPVFSGETQQHFKDLQLTYQPDHATGTFVLSLLCEGEGGPVRCSWQSQAQAWSCNYR